MGNEVREINYNLAWKHSQIFPIFSVFSVPLWFIFLNFPPLSRTNKQNHHAFYLLIHSQTLPSAT